MLQDYQVDGAAVARSLLPREIIDSARDAVERALSAPRATGVDYVPPGGEGRFFNDSFLSRQDPAFEDLVMRPELLELAGRLLGAKRIGLLFDQLLVKEPNTAQNMPWHQDLPYWPVEQPRLVTIWVPLDPVTRQSGAVLYARGSHTWDTMSRRWHLPRRDGSTPSLVEESAEMVDPSFVHWDVEPGDVIVHHPCTVHGSPGNKTADVRRRAIALRYFADDCRYRHRAKHILENPKILALLPPLSFSDGDPIESEAFPILWEA